MMKATDPLMTPIDNKNILTDVDGVLLDWHGPFRRWMAEQGFVEDLSQKTYSLAKKYHLDENQMREMVIRYNRSAAVGFCPAERDAVHYVRRLGERGFKFICITAMGGDRFSEMLRIQNLERLFGQVFINHHFVGLNESKDHILELYNGTECWWIEDKLSNAEAGLKHGLRPILIRHEYNAHCDSEDILVVDNWKQIFTIVTGEQYVQ
jgi:FMN phosphatase YigB (HAD superfamily)